MVNISKSVVYSLFILGSFTLFFTNCAKEVPVVDKKAHANVVKLYNFLSDTTQKGIMFGHEDTYSYGIGWKYEDDPGSSDVEKVCGDFPAVYGWDIGHLEIGSKLNIDSVSFDHMRHFMQKAHKEGGFNTISWHPHNPVTGGSSWDTAGSVVKRILPGGDHAEKYRGWLVTVAEYLKSVKDDNGMPIPIVFRPYHEHNGSWFWWGDKFCSTEEYVGLWKYTTSFLRDTMDVHNLLYAYSPNLLASKEDYLKKYPGDEWVDVLGVDLYDFPHYGVDYSKQLPKSLSILSEIAKEKNKPSALTETGYLNEKPEKWWTESLLGYSKGYGIKWFLVWINLEEKQYYGPVPGNKSAADFKDFYADSETIFLKDMPEIYK